jgi:hypothetical protein
MCKGKAGLDANYHELTLIFSCAEKAAKRNTRIERLTQDGTDLLAAKMHRTHKRKAGTERF